MALGITSVVSGSAQLQSRVQSAQREAQQAEQVARNLRSQAEAAQRSADQEQDRADGLSTKARGASDRSEQARGALAGAQQAAARGDARLNLMPANAPFINAYGQVTGGLLSERA